MSKHQYCRECNRDFVGPDYDINENLCPECDAELHADCTEQIQALTAENNEHFKNIKALNADRLLAEEENRRLTAELKSLKAEKGMADMGFVSEGARAEIEYLNKTITEKNQYANGFALKCKELTAEVEMLKKENDSLGENHEITRDLLLLADDGLRSERFRSKSLTDEVERLRQGIINDKDNPTVLIPKELDEARDKQIQALTTELEAAKKEIERLKIQVNQITFSNDGKDKFAKAYRAEMARLKDVLRDLLDIQNGAPLVRDTEKWEKIVARGYDLLALKDTGQEAE